ncbi:glycosyltransferase [Vibrio tasmaniensis]|uniref:glycosyltransferase n=1 Tax=Vibrio tasmaniensis TaxID=212663 RepID=UPI00111A8188|nr:glycosyltransferase [Vibrio tasmaniensis]
MGIAMKIVLSGVNLVEAGPLKIFSEAIEAFAITGETIICLVNSKELFPHLDYPNIEFYEFPEVKKSWGRRLKFEYLDSYKLAKELKPDCWVSMHDMSPRLPEYVTQYVYCHNAAPFYTAGIFDLYFSPKFFLFSLFYFYLYRINLFSNKIIFCQQDWIVNEFKNKYGISNVIAAKPILNLTLDDDFDEDLLLNISRDYSERVKVFYPTLARTFKNIELIINAVKLSPSLEKSFVFFITISESDSAYAKSLVNQTKHLDCFRFIGYQRRREINSYYKSCDVLLFPSKLETWGLPISEAKYFNLPILVADMPYAHETIGSYDKVCFVDPNDAYHLQVTLEKLIHSFDDVFVSARYENSNQVLDGWSELVNEVIDK